MIATVEFVSPVQREQLQLSKRRNQLGPVLRFQVLEILKGFTDLKCPNFNRWAFKLICASSWHANELEICPVLDFTLGWISPLRCLSFTHFSKKKKIQVTILIGSRATIVTRDHSYGKLVIGSKCLYVLL